MVTVICRRAFSRLSLLFAGLVALPSWAAVSLAVDSIRHPAFEADGVNIAFDTGRKGEADIRIGRLKLGGIEYRDLSLACGDFVIDLRRLECPHGLIQRADTRGGERPGLPFSFSYRFSDGRLEFAVIGADAIAWSPLIKRLRSLRPEGAVDLHLIADRKAAELSLAVHRLKFSNAEGDLAAEGVEASLTASALRTGDDWQWQARLDWYQGELYAAPWYRRAGVQATLGGRLTPEVLHVSDGQLAIAGIGNVTAGLRWDRKHGELGDWAFVTDDLDLSTAFREWVQPWLDRSGTPPVQASGRVRFAASWSGGEWQSFYAGLENAALADGTNTLALADMNAQIPWQRDGDSEAWFSVGGGRLGELPLGGFRIPVRLRANEVNFLALSIPLLDGRLTIDQLDARREPEGWTGRFAGGIAGVSMPKLSGALKLPRMEGSLDARIPKARYQRGVLSLGGDIVIDVFDGRIAVTNLMVLDPLRPTQRLLADVNARRLDLGMLTRTFSVGSIEGRFDADLVGLEMQGGQALRFDARIASSPGDYPRSFSKGAVQDITSLGGEMGGRALAATPVGLVNRYGYERIGLSCSLRGNICRMDGMEPVGDGYRIVKGSGLPRVDVIGYNRNVDWSLLLSRIRAVIAGNTEAVIE